MTEQHLGKVIDGRYRLDELLGEGAAGAVYAATQLSVDRTVAVKLLHGGDSEQFASRFQEEARAIGKLNHTNIITLHDFGYDDDIGIHYMVTEFADGVPLSTRMKEVMGTDLVLKIALEVASAMHHAHAEGILHRDLKPENIILTRADGRVDVAKVLDFGLAELYEPAEMDVPEASQSATLTTMDDYAEKALDEDSAAEAVDEAAAVAEPEPAAAVEPAMSLSELAGDEPELPPVADEGIDAADGAPRENDEDEPATAILPPLDLSGDSRAEQPDASDEEKPGEVNE